MGGFSRAVVASLFLAASALVAGCPSKTCESNDGCPAGKACVSGACVDSEGQGGGGPECADASGKPADLQTDPDNCGSCAHRCPAPVNAEARCVKGACGRSACAPGFFDLDGPKTFGCESRCDGGFCVDGQGKGVQVHNVPLHETGLAGKAVAAGAALGSTVQTNATHSNFASIGEAAPAVDGGLDVRNAQHLHRGGFGARYR